MAGSTLTEFLAEGRRNALLSWALVALAAAVWIEEVVVSEFLWSIFALIVVGLALLPPIIYRSRYVMLPWEVLALALLPIIGLAIGTQRFVSPLFAYIALAAVALIIAVELDIFTSIRMSPGFAIVFVVAGTMAAAALWALLGWYWAILLDQSFEMTNDELMIEFLYAATAGVVAGVIFRAYFRQRVTISERLPSDLSQGETDV